MAEDLDIIDRVELCLKGLDGIATIAAHLQSKFSSDLEVAPAARGLSILSSDATARLDDVAEELHNTRSATKPSADPLVELGYRYRHAMVECNDGPGGDEEAQQHFDIAQAAADEIAKTAPITLAGAAAQIRYVVIGMEEMDPEATMTPLQRRWLASLRQMLVFLEEQP